MSAGSQDYTVGAGNKSDHAYNLRNNGSYHEFCEAADYLDQLEARLAETETALLDKIAEQGARLTEADVIIRIVNGGVRHFEEGAYLVRLYHDDFERMVAWITASAPAVRCEHEWRPYAFDLVSGAPSSYYCPRCGVNRATTTVSASGAELTDEEKEGLQGIREGMNR